MKKDVCPQFVAIRENQGPRGFYNDLAGATNDEDNYEEDEEYEEETSSDDQSYQDSVSTDPSDPDEQPALIKESSFCVFCEQSVNCAVSHANEFHGMIDYTPGQRCYEVKQFQNRRIVAPRGDPTNTEVSTCLRCHGVFFHHRRRNHRCTAMGIDEGTGDEYCLLCQFRCQDVDEHLQSTHHGNATYEILLIRGIRTLLPRYTDLSCLSYNCYPCECGDCLRFTYRARLRQVCNPGDLLLEYVNEL